MNPSIRQGSFGRHEGPRAARRGAGGLLLSLLVAAGLAAPCAARAAPPPGTPIDNVAEGSGLDPAGNLVAAWSNLVRTRARAITYASLGFYADAGYTTRTRAYALGAPLYVQLEAPDCDRDPFARDTVHLELTSDPPGDVEAFIALETGPATGVFRIEPAVPMRVVVGPPPAIGDGTLEVQVNGEVRAAGGACGGPPAAAAVLIEPQGLVFDAQSGLPVPGVRVSLIDMTGAGNGGDPGGPARVYDLDGATPRPSQVVTGSDGRYAFPWVAPSTYRLALDTPTGWTFPSGLAPGALPGTRPIDPAASYGAPFATSAPDASVRWDVPLDGAPAPALAVDKGALQVAAGVGDVVDYQVRVQSLRDSALAGVTVTDLLPLGFAYLPGSARRDTLRLPEPDGGDGSLTFAIGDLAPREAAVVRYRVRVGPGALDGDGVNRAYASAGDERSNTASVRVRLADGPFAAQAILVGTVWVDLDGDGLREPGEPGMPGVRLYLDDGTFAITDVSGQYSLYGLTPRGHALKLDRATLPPGAWPRTLDRRDQGTPGLRWVDLQAGELQRADFSLAGDALVAEAAAARAATRGLWANELGLSLMRQLRPVDELFVPSDPRARPAAGIVGGDGRMPLFGAAADSAARAAGTGPAGVPAPVAEEGAPQAAGFSEPSSTATPEAAPPPVPVRLSVTSAPDSAGLARIAATLVPGTGFVGLADGETVLADHLDVLVKGAPGAPFELEVDGQRIPETRVSRRMLSLERGVEVWEYLGLRLKPGVNHLEVEQWSAGGALLGRAFAAITAPGPVERLALVVPPQGLADGFSAVPVQVRLFDGAGLPAQARTLVTLDASAGRWEENDLDPGLAGLQVAIAGGEGSFGLIAPPEAGVVRVRAEADRHSAEADIAFVPELRPLLVSGTFEGILSFRGHSRFGSAAPARPRTGFEQAPERFVSESSDGVVTAAARGAVFAKGRLGRDVQLTLGYDSDKPETLTPFRDLQPDAFYPVYGDASVRGFDAQSTGALYARLDRAGSYLLQGDFVTPGDLSVRSLAGYSRSLNGTLAHWQDRSLALDAFASQTRLPRRVVEIPADGTSGPYGLAGAPLVANTERVSIVVRDRDQPAVVLRSTTLSRITDYTLEPLSGELLFKQPVLRYDGELNPVSIRVDYAVEEGGDAVWVLGARGAWRPLPRLELGGTYVDDQALPAVRELRGVSARFALAPRATAEIEWAGTRTQGLSSGDAVRVELRHDEPRLQARLYGAITDSAFDNPDAGYAPGRRELGGRLQAKLDDRTGVRGELLYTGSPGDSLQNGGLMLALDRDLGRSWRGELGVRGAYQRPRVPGETDPTLALRTRLTALPGGRSDLSAYGEFEQNLFDSRRMAALGGEYRFHARARAYARHELISSLRGPYALSTAQRQLSTVVGIEASLARDARAFSEYRLDDALSGRDAEAVLGLRNSWQVGDGIRLGGSFERVSPLEGSDAGPATALSGSVEYLGRGPWSGSSRAEVRTGRGSDQVLLNTAAAVRLSAAWTGLARQLAIVSDERAAGHRSRNAFQVGFAYRDPASERWDALGRYELRSDHERDADDALRDRQAHIVSLQGTRRLEGPVAVSLGWAAKQVHSQSVDGTDRLDAQWLRGRVTWDLAARWDAGLQASVLATDGFSAARHGVGLEVGRQLGGGVWLSGGWNLWGVEDEDLPNQDWTREGWYLRLRGRFDEQTLAGLGRWAR